MIECDDDAALLVTGVDVAVSVGDSIEGEAAVDHRLELSLFGQTGEEAHVVRGGRLRAGDDLLIGGQREPGRAEQVGQTAEDLQQAPALAERALAARERCRPGGVDDDVVRLAVFVKSSLV